MDWGHSFKSAWDHATSTSRLCVSKLAAGATAVAHATAAAVQQIAKEAQAITKTASAVAVSEAEVMETAVTKAGVSAANVTQKVVSATATAIKSEASNAAKAVQQKGLQAEKALVTIGVAAGSVTVEAVAAAYRLARNTFSSIAAGVATATCVLENWTVGGITLAAGSILSKPVISDLLRPVLRIGGDESQKQFDGDVFGSQCQSKNGYNPTGVMPTGCRQTAGTLPKSSYINGINTTYTQSGNTLFSGGICKTMQAIADATCSEVTGIYNATEGIGKDVDECLDNIAKASSAPSVVPLRELMVQAAREGTPLTLFAHSQGGLITQEAIAKAKQQLMREDQLSSEEAEAELSVVSIKSFGTAIMGWPKGPHYERFTNTADPIPPIITGAQTSYPIETWGDSAPADQHHVFTSPHINPIDSHSMDDTYLPEFESVKGTLNCACKAA